MPDERGTCPSSGVSHWRIGEAIVNDARYVIAVMTILDQHDDGGRGAAVTGLCWRRCFTIGAVC